LFPFFIFHISRGVEGLRKAIALLFSRVIDQAVKNSADVVPLSRLSPSAVHFFRSCGICRLPCLFLAGVVEGMHGAYPLISFHGVWQLANHPSLSSQGIDAVSFWEKIHVKAHSSFSFLVIKDTNVLPPFPSFSGFDP